MLHVYTTDHSMQHQPVPISSVSVIIIYCQVQTPLLNYIFRAFDQIEHKSFDTRDSIYSQYPHIVIVS